LPAHVVHPTKSFQVLRSVQPQPSTSNHMCSLHHTKQSWAPGWAIAYPTACVHNPVHLAAHRRSVRGAVTSTCFWRLCRSSTSAAAVISRCHWLLCRWMTRALCRQCGPWLPSPRSSGSLWREQVLDYWSVALLQLLPFFINWWCNLYTDMALTADDSADSSLTTADDTHCCFLSFKHSPFAPR